ncbi:MAG: hypothetical protein E3J24_03355 [Dehalococcoidia bacterium]|nr:MAG: hypothetical protein E3J24_03355 [Dehalococcoidia bacterium]
MAEEQTNDSNLTEEEKQALRDAHTFAADRQMHENRLFWTRVAALLTGNSLLIAGFTILYVRWVPLESSAGNDTNWVLLAIAAAGILIQAMWPLVAAYSYMSDRYWSRLMEDTESLLFPVKTTAKTRPTILDHARRIWTSYDDYLRSALPKRLRLMDKPAGFWATVVFFLSFLAIWLVAAIMVKPSDGQWVAVGIPVVMLVFIIIPCLIVYLYAKKRTRNATIKAVR